MKVVIIACLFIFLNAEGLTSITEVSAEDSNSSLVEIARGYHQRIGILEAERIKLREGVISRIAGSVSSYLGEHPYMVGLLVTLTTGQTSVCGGTLVSSTRVVTAASCWNDGYSHGSSILVVLGSISLYTGGTRVRASVIYSHPYFNPFTSANDIAILVIPYVSYTTYIKPATLPYGSYLTNSFAGISAEVIGYGRTAAGSPITSAQSLRDLYLTVMTNSECQLYYGYYVSSGVVCTNGAGHRGPCGGDKGGPLIHRYFDRKNHMLIGVTSFWSANGCEAPHPTGYTRVTAYNIWIRSLL